MKKILASCLTLVAVTAGAGCLVPQSEETVGVDTPSSYALRGGINIVLQPETSFDEDELLSRNGYGATLTEPSGSPWFTRVEFVTADSLDTLGLLRSSVNGRSAFVGTVTDEDGPDCRIYLAIDGQRALALSRPGDDVACPSSVEAVQAWLPIVVETASHSFGLGEAKQALSFGSWVGNYNGIDAYSNGSNLYVNGAYSCCGLKWQCVEYANRYYYQKLGHQNLKYTGNANQYFGTASAKGLVAYANTSSTPPAVQDMLVSNGGASGHIAIVREVGSNYIKVIHQNWANDTSDNSKTLSMSYANGKYTVSGFSSSYPVKGWLRRPSSCTPVVTSVSPTTAWLNTSTTFTVGGSCLPSSLAAWVDQCANLSMLSVSSTSAKFKCTPSYSIGTKSGVIKNQSGGTTLKSFTVTVK